MYVLGESGTPPQVKSEREKRMLLLTLVNSVLYEDLRKDEYNLHRK